MKQKNYFKKIIYAIIILLIILLPIIFYALQKNDISIKFDSLQNIKAYIEKCPENVKGDTDNWEDPQFISFYKNEFRSTLIDNILKDFGIYKNKKFDIRFFAQLLKKVTEARLSQPINKKVVLEPQIGTKIIIFGDIHGAIHSFYRDLIELKNIGYLGEDLKITRDNLFIIIIGDAVNKNPYSLEVLNTILLLMDKNPKQVIYSQGNHERNEYWENFQMVSELKIKGEELSKDISSETPLKNEINKFFDTLCQTVLIKCKNEDKIIITHAKVQEPINGKIKLIIFGEKKFDVLKESSGLEFIGYKKGAAKWSTLSCPTKTYQDFFNFHNDAFSELLIGNSAKNSEISVYKRNINGAWPGKFEKISYNPVFGYEIKNKKDDIENRQILTIGSSMALTGVTGPLGYENKAGLESAILKNNKNNEILIMPIIFNDDNTAKIALSNIKSLIKNYKIDTFVLPTGNSSLLLYLNMVQAGKISVFFPCDGGQQFRKKELKNIIHFRPSYDQEAKALINYLVNAHGIKNFAFFYQNDSYGKPMADVAKEELKKLGITDWLDLPHLKSESDFLYTIQEVKKKMPEAIACFSSTFATQEFINQLGGEFFSGRIVFGPSTLYSNAIEKFLQYRGINSIFTSVVPDPLNKNIEIVKEFSDKMSKRGFGISSNALEGYIAGALLAEAANKIEKPVTREKIMKFFESMKNFKFKGLNLSFNPETRDLGQPVWIKKLNNKLIKY